ncbi:hypothetical protein SAMN05421827_109147 [Pedobacter terrae]|uniref:Uncharacterized protein n=1 Tax=Pedobacter terrae TaxID=405671 RepID=A0A1G7W8K6_9SPHI|nr:hypothetical protein [Pedobacter terrae]SDG68282.1 hypothetical protein SAMN05421827_109147 [Pedobacter terrae]
MSVTLASSPQLHSFSNSYITAKFQCADYFQQVGSYAVNSINIAAITAPGTIIEIKYGNNTVTMMSALAPDDSGSQFLCGNGTALPASDVAGSFQSNHQLSTDFDISFSGYNIIFTAKQKTIGFDFISGGTNTTIGKAEIVKPNYRVFFRLFLENNTHTGYDEIYKTYLDIQNGSGGLAIAELGDKIHQKITADIDEYGLEVPGITVLSCMNTARKFYFEFAESFGDTITVKKLLKSNVFNVLHGGLSFQSKSSVNLVSLIAGGSPTEDRFLKQGPKSQYGRIDQPQFLYFFNTRSTKAGAKLLIKRFFSDGSSDSANDLTFNLDQHRKFAFNVSPGNIYNGVKQLDRYEINLIDNAGNRISEKQEYFIKRDGQRYLRYFLNWSSWGSLDSRCFTGVNQPTLEINSSKASRLLQSGYKVTNGEFKVYGKTGTDKFKASTGFNDPDIIKFNKDFFLSNLQFRYIKNTILPIEVTSDSVAKPADSDFLYAQSFEYQYLYSNQNYLENDIEDDFSFSGSSFQPPYTGPILILAGTPANPSKQIIQQQIS